MAETFITADSKKIHYWDRTIGANTVLDEFTLPGEYPLASYSIVTSNVAISTANAHCLQIMAGSSLNVRIRSIHIEQAANTTGVSVQNIEIRRLTTAGTGGTAITPEKFNTADAASGATAMTLPTVKGTETGVLVSTVLICRQALLATATQPDDDFVWRQNPNGAPIVIPAGTANGIAIKVLNGVTSATAAINVEIVETSF